MSVGLPHSIAIVTDAWHPQMNGVVRTLATTCDVLRSWGHEVSVISPDQFTSFPAPTYPEIRLALTWPGATGRALAKIKPDAVHIATAGPLGFAARRYCMNQKVPFTTAYHTQFPDYLSRRTRLPASVFWPYIRRFHRPAQRVMVATESVRRQLRDQGLTNLISWSRGVDLSCFMSGGSRLRRTARLFSPATIQAPRSLLAMDQRGQLSKRSFPTPFFSASVRAWNWPGVTQARMCASSQA